MKTAKNWSKVLLAGMAVLLLTFGLVAVGCKDKSSPGGGSGGGIPTELVGKWCPNQYQDHVMFEITSEKKFIMNDVTFSISVSGKTVSVVSYSGTSVGTFDYAISGGKLAVSNETVAFSGLSAGNPYVRK
ncbi:MAG: hypothetical protein Ta2A_08060 [Treponemataceae bacterium]|nr:MAG: hypothetical protein Ta2A_08060 [Treponemataceae bacterium]